MADGGDSSRMRPLRPAAPPDGPLASSGAAPGPAPRETADPVPRPRDPVPSDALRPSAPQPPTPVTPAPATTADPAPAGPGTSTAPAEPVTGATRTGDPTDAAAKAASPADTTDPAAKADGPGGTTAEGDGPTGTTDTSAKDDAAAKDDVPAKDGAAAKDDVPAKDNAAAEDDVPAEDGAAPAGGGSPPATPGRAARRRYRVPFAHAVRLPPPRQAAAGAVRATRAWSKRPSGRFVLPGLLLLALVSVTAAAGAVLIPATAPDPRPVAEEAGASASTGPTAGPTVPGGVVLPPGVTPLPGQVTPGGVVAPVPTGRPADALADWAQRTGTKVGIAPTAMQAYGYAELVLAQTTPGCALSWTTLAAIGYVESRHGQANGATLLPDGRALPEIIGDPLDGNGGRMRIMDTDRGRLDRDLTFDRAVGPMQFIPTTWEEIGADADNDGVENPHDLDDAALAAGNYLCKGGRNMTVAGDWWGAILSYNDVRQYAQDVFDKANEYGRTSRG